MATVANIIFVGSKITSDSDCSHKIKRHLLLGRNAMTDLESILKTKNITLLTKAMAFPVVIYGYESWTTKKEHQRIDAFELWCWRRFLRVPWTERRSNQSVNPKRNQPWIFIGRTVAEALILWPPDAKRQFIGKDPDAEKDWRQKEEGGIRGWDG